MAATDIYSQKVVPSGTKNLLITQAEDSWTQPGQGQEVAEEGKGGLEDAGSLGKEGPQEALFSIAIVGLGLGRSLKELMFLRA